MSFLRDSPSAVPTRSTVAALLLVAVLAFTHKAIYFSALRSEPDFQQLASSPDSPSYFEPAMDMLAGKPFHSLTRTPGYPAFLSAVYGIARTKDPASASGLLALFLAQAGVLVAGVVPVFFAAKKLSGAPAGWIAGSLWALHNGAAISSTRLMTEAVAAAVVCWLVLALVLAMSGRPLWRWVTMVGLILASLVLIRPSFLYLPALLGLIYFFRALSEPEAKRGTKFRIFVGAVIIVGIPVLTVFGWTARNGRVEGQAYFSRLSSFGLWAMSLQSAVDVADGGRPQLAKYHEEFSGLVVTTTPAEQDAIYRRRSLEVLRSRPGAVLRYWGVKSLWMLIPASPDRGFRPALRIDTWTPSQLPYFYFLANSAFEMMTTVATLGALVLAVWLHFRGRPALPPLVLAATWVCIGYWWLVHANANAGSRYLFPIVPLLITTGTAAAARYAQHIYSAKPHATEFH